MPWPKRFPCNKGPLHSRDLTPRALMAGAAHTPCDRGHILMIRKKLRLSSPPWSQQVYNSVN